MKIIDFDPDNENDSLNINQASISLFLHVFFQEVFSNQPDSIVKVIKSGIPEKHSDFGKGICQFLLSTFYNRIKKQNEGKIP